MRLLREKTMFLKIRYFRFPRSDFKIFGTLKIRGRRSYYNRGSTRGAFNPEASNWRSRSTYWPFLKILTYLTLSFFNLVRPDSERILFSGNESAGSSRRGSYNVSDHTFDPHPLDNINGLYFAIRIRSVCDRYSNYESLKSFFQELENEFYNLCQRGATDWRDLANFRDSSYKTDSLIRSSIFNIDKFIDFRESENPKYFAKVLRFNFMAHIFVSRIKSKAYQVCNKKLI